MKTESTKCSIAMILPFFLLASTTTMRIVHANVNSIITPFPIPRHIAGSRISLGLDLDLDLDSNIIQNNVHADKVVLLHPNQITQLMLLSTRGGASNNQYDEYDAYDDEYDDEYDPQENYRRPSSRNNPRFSPPPPPPQHRRRPPPRNNNSNRNQYRNQNRRKPKSSTILKTTSDMAQKSIHAATSATMSTLKTSGKAAYYLTAPKHVTKDEIYGVWRFDQCIGSSACAANIEFTYQGDAITRYTSTNTDSNNAGEDVEEEFITGYLFQSKSWPRSCSIEFEANAFQGMEDERPVRYYYKGYFSRKMADRSVIKIVGKIYEVKQRFWKGKSSPGVPGVEVGSFVARKRMRAGDRSNSRTGTQDKDQQVLDQDEYYDDQYDAYDDYDDDYDMSGEVYDHYDINEE